MRGLNKGRALGKTPHRSAQRGFVGGQRLSLLLRSVPQTEAASARDSVILAIHEEFPGPGVAMRAQEPRAPSIEGCLRERQRQFIGNRLATWPDDPVRCRILEWPKQVVGINGIKVVRDSSHETSIATVWLLLGTQAEWVGYPIRQAFYYSTDHRISQNTL
jgi:hypothetical protein